MKKLFITLSLVAFAMTANAQFVLSGNLGLTSTGGTFTNESPSYDYPNTKTSNLLIAPSVGYVLNDNIQIGLSLNYNYGKTTTYNPIAYAAGYEDWSINSGSSFGIAPYFRYYFAKVNKFNFFCQAELAFNFTPKTHYELHSTVPVVGGDSEGDGITKISDINFAIVPGINYSLNDKWSADLYIDLASFYINHNAVKTYNGDDLVSTDAYNSCGLVATAAAQDLNSHLTNFRLGFNFHF